MTFWHYAQPTIAADSRSQDNKRLRAARDVVPVPERQPADPGR
jgi:hypothetical protein